MRRRDRASEVMRLREGRTIETLRMAAPGGTGCGMEWTRHITALPCAHNPPHDGPIPARPAALPRSGGRAGSSFIDHGPLIKGMEGSMELPLPQLVLVALIDVRGVCERRQ